MMTDEMKQQILVWAQNTLDRLPDGDFGDDWWGAYSDSLDVNIWWDDTSKTIRVTAYDMTGTDPMSNFESLGTIDVSVRNHDRDTCGYCDKTMSIKWGSTYPHRHDEYGVVCGECWNALIYSSEHS